MTTTTTPRISPMQRNILKNTTSAQKSTPAILAGVIDSKPGPVARAAHCLVKKGWLAVGETKDGETFFKRTAEGGKIAKKL